MEKYSGIIILGAILCDDGRGCLLFLPKVFFHYWMIKRDPVATRASIVSYYPKAPNDRGEVSIVLTYSFSAGGKIYSKANQFMTINTVDLDKVYVGKRGTCDLLSS